MPITLNLDDLQIVNNLFYNNFGGKNGSAVFLLDITNITLINNSFKYNTAVYSKYEIIYSAFYRYLSKGIPFTFFDGIHNFTHEFQFIMLKSFNLSDQTYTTLTAGVNAYSMQYPYVKGALSVAFSN